MDTSFDDAIRQWQSCLGSEHVVQAAEPLGAAERTTFATVQRICAILRPATREQVQSCVRVANAHRVPLYPVSGGRNWGLGSRVPASTENVLLDLGRLNRIVDFNEKLAYLTVEPGVTFRQAYNFLRQRGNRLCLAVTGGPADGSLIGNTVERGDATGPLGDRLSHVCGLEVVMPTGEVIHTGFGRYRQARTTSVSRHGVGPALDGLFTQSNLGIVTQMTMWLFPQPVFVRPFVCRVEGPAVLSRVLDAAQPLMLHGVLPSHCFGVWNSYKFAAGFGQYPWAAAGDQTPLRFACSPDALPWYGGGAIYAPSAEVGLGLQRILHESLTPHVGLLMFPANDPNLDLFRGVPTDQNARSTYWRRRSPIPAELDPDRDLCGVHWLCHELPWDGTLIVEWMGRIESQVLAHGFEPAIGLGFPSGRSVHMYLALVYDRAVPGQDDRALACHDAVMGQLIEAGYLPYRLGIQSMGALPRPDDDSAGLLQRMKRSLDPNDILAPGRYDFRAHWSQP